MANKMELLLVIVLLSVPVFQDVQARHLLSEDHNDDSCGDCCEKDGYDCKDKDKHEDKHDCKDKDKHEDKHDCKDKDEHEDKHDCKDKDKHDDKDDHKHKDKYDDKDDHKDKDKHDDKDKDEEDEDEKWRKPCCLCKDWDYEQKWYPGVDGNCPYGGYKDGSGYCCDKQGRFPNVLGKYADCNGLYPDGYGMYADCMGRYPEKDGEWYRYKDCEHY